MNMTKNFNNDNEFFNLEKFKYYLSKEEIKAIRKSYNLSQRCFADLININVRTLQNYECGTRKVHGPVRSLFLFVRDNKKEILRKYKNRVFDIREFYS